MGRCDVKANPEIQVLFGLGLILYALVTLVCAIGFPKYLDNPFLRPRWWGFGPRATRLAVVFGSGVWLTIGGFVLGNAFDVISATMKQLLFLSLVLFLIAAGIAQFATSDKDEP